MALRFTVATVTFNAASTIERTLLSVASQSYEQVEHLIVDGCSQDGTMKNIQRYIERNCNACHPHSIRLVREPDEGLYDAMNKAIALAKGDFIIFLNAGDKFHSTTTLEEVARQMQYYDPQRLPAVVYGETDIVDDEGNFQRHRRLAAPERLVSRSFLSGMLVCHQSFYVRTDLARTEPYDLRYRYSGDYDWCIRVMHRAERRYLSFHNTKLILTDYLNEGMTTRNHRRSLLERLRIMAHHFGWWYSLIAHAWFVVRAVVKK